MSSLFVALFARLASSFRTRAARQAEILALRHQLAVLQKNAPRRTAATGSCGLCVPILVRLAAMSADGSARHSPALAPRAFAWHWTRKSRRHPGRPEAAAKVRDLIRRMRQANPFWGAPRIHGELLKLGIAVAQSTVARYLPDRPISVADFAVPEARLAIYVDGAVFHDIVNALRKDGLLTGPPFSQPIDFVYFDLWHYDGRTSKHGAFMGGADFVQ